MAIPAIDEGKNQKLVRRRSQELESRVAVKNDRICASMLFNLICL